VEDLTIVERCSWTSDYTSIWLKKELFTSTVMKEILISGCKYGSNDEHQGTVKYMISLSQKHQLVSKISFFMNIGGLSQF